MNAPIKSNALRSLMPDRINYVEQVEHQAELFASIIDCALLTSDTRLELQRAINAIEDRVRQEIAELGDKPAPRFVFVADPT